MDDVMVDLIRQKYPEFEETPEHEEILENYELGLISQDMYCYQYMEEATRLFGKDNGRGAGRYLEF